MFKRRSSSSSSTRKGVTVESLPTDWAVGVTLTGTVDHPEIQGLGKASKVLSTLMMRSSLSSSAADMVSSKLRIPRWIAVGIGRGVTGRGNLADMGITMPPLP